MMVTLSDELYLRLCCCPDQPHLICRPTIKVLSEVYPQLPRHRHGTHDFRWNRVVRSRGSMARPLRLGVCIPQPTATTGPSSGLDSSKIVASAASQRFGASIEARFRGYCAADPTTAAGARRTPHPGSAWARPNPRSLSSSQRPAQALVEPARRSPGLQRAKAPSPAPGDALPLRQGTASGPPP